MAHGYVPFWKLFRRSFSLLRFFFYPVAHDDDVAFFFDILAAFFHSFHSRYLFPSWEKRRRVRDFIFTFGVHICRAVPLTRNILFILKFALVTPDSLSYRRFFFAFCFIYSRDQCNGKPTWKLNSAFTQPARSSSLKIKSTRGGRKESRSWARYTFWMSKCVSTRLSRIAQQFWVSFSPVNIF